MAQQTAAEKAKKRMKKLRQQNKPKLTQRESSEESQYLILKHDAMNHRLPPHKLKQLKELELKRAARLEREKTEREAEVKQERATSAEQIAEKIAKYEANLLAAESEQDPKKAKKMKRRANKMLKKYREKQSALEHAQPSSG